MRTVSDEEHARRLTAYRAAPNDSDAAAALGLQAVTFRAWRKANALPAKQAFKPRRPNGARKVVKVSKSAVAAALARIQEGKLDAIRTIQEDIRAKRPR
jgi:hypothetical protein